MPPRVEATDQTEAIDDWLPPAYDLPEALGPDAVADMPPHPLGGSPSVVGPRSEDPKEDDSELAAQPWQRWEAERSGERGRLEKNALLFAAGLLLLLAVAALLTWL